MTDLLHDLRYALRTAAKNPGFTAIVVLTLALGISVNAAVFSLVDAVLFRPLPAVNPKELVQLYGTQEKGGSEKDFIAYPIYQEYAGQANCFSGLAAYRHVFVNFSAGEDSPKLVSGAVVTGNYFNLFGLPAERGRLFAETDDGPRGSNPVVVLSDRLWRRRFGAKPEVIGSTVRINRQQFTVIGIAPASLQDFDLQPELWVPMSMAMEAEPIFKTQIDRVTNPFFEAIGRLKPGVSIQQAQSQLDVTSERMGAGKKIRVWEGLEGEQVGTKPDTKELLESYEWSRPWATLFPAEKIVDRDAVRLSWLLISVAALVLLIATTDVAGLFLARADHQQKEIAVRVVLGASWMRLVRYRVMEGLLYALLAAAVGIVLASWGTSLLSASAPANLPLRLGLRASFFDVRVLVFVVGVTVFAGICFSLLSGFRASQNAVMQALKSEQRSIRRTPVSGISLQGSFVVLQVVVSVVLLIGAGVLLKTLRNAAAVNLGFDTEHVLSASLELSKQGYNKTQAAALLDPLLEKARELPGVQSAALRAGTLIQKRRAGDSWKDRTPNCANLPLNLVSPGYFETLGIPLLRGHDFSRADTKDAAGVVIVNQAAAQFCWPNDDPIGKHFDGILVVRRPFQIIGIVGNVNDERLDPNPRPQMYGALPQFYQAIPWQVSLSVLVRTKLAPHAVVPSLLAALQTLDRDLSFHNIETPREQLADAFSQEHFLSKLLTVFGGLAVVLAMSGLYGLLSFITDHRTREFGIRMAVGAQRRDILRLVLSQGAGLVVAGVGIGIGAAYASTRALRGMLYGVKANDPVTFIGVVILLAFVALLACYIPARRATKVDPLAALRHE